MRTCKYIIFFSNCIANQTLKLCPHPTLLFWQLPLANKIVCHFGFLFDNYQVFIVGHQLPRRVGVFARGSGEGEDEPLQLDSSCRENLTCRPRQCKYILLLNKFGHKMGYRMTGGGGAFRSTGARHPNVPYFSTTDENFWAYPINLRLVYFLFLKPPILFSANLHVKNINVSTVQQEHCTNQRA